MTSSVPTTPGLAPTTQGDPHNATITLLVSISLMTTKSDLGSPASVAALKGTERRNLEKLPQN